MGTSDDLFVLGINAYDHDVSACLLKNGAIVAAIAKERITRGDLTSLVGMMPKSRFIWAVRLFNDLVKD